jgi:predicted nucleotide-binding protein
MANGSNPIADYSFWASSLLRAAVKTEGDRIFFAPIMSSLEWASGIVTGATSKSNVTRDHIGEHQDVVADFYLANGAAQPYTSAPPAVKNTHKTFALFCRAGNSATELSKEAFALALKHARVPRRAQSRPAPKKINYETRRPGRKVFIGHGRSKLWREVQSYLRDDLHLKCEAFESESRVGKYVGPVLQQMLRRCGFAVIVVTKDDSAGRAKGDRPRMNVVHEAGLTQGMYGFERVALLEQGGVRLFSNVDGLQTVRFNGDDIKATFGENHKMLVREGFMTQPKPAGARSQGNAH